jgi:hypothetical protein
VAFDGNERIQILNPSELEGYSLSGGADFPEITEREINDRSKGNFLSKSLVIVQTGWFVTQCIARRVQNLPITELEIVTLAFAALNFVTYGLWWYKPLDVECSVRVYKRRRTSCDHCPNLAHPVTRNEGVGFTTVSHFLLFS